MVISIYLAVASQAIIYWIFSLKYWSIALKIELAIQEQEVTQKDKLIAYLLFGGIGVLSVLAVSAPYYTI